MRFILYAFIAAGLAASPILRRHDVPDEKYLAFATELPVTSSVVRYNTTDVAGTLITPEWILSAAHVAETMKPGQLLLACGGDSLEVDKIILHPGWIDHGRPEDVALIRISRPVSGIEPVALYSDSDELGQEVFIIGNGDFGTGLEGPEASDGRMRAATNRVDEVSEAYLKWVFDDPRTNPERATSMEGISGPGDSAGPAFVRVGDAYLLAGIGSGQSTQATGGKEGLYGVTEYYARVSTYRGWIEETIRKEK